jgi:hypothetical protein
MKTFSYILTIVIFANLNILKKKWIPMDTCFIDHLGKQKNVTTTTFLNP